MPCLICVKEWFSSITTSTFVGADRVAALCAGTLTRGAIALGDGVALGDRGGVALGDGSATDEGAALGELSWAAGLVEPHPAATTSDALISGTSNRDLRMRPR
jgi:hypothetical protein